MKLSRLSIQNRLLFGLAFLVGGYAVTLTGGFLASKESDARLHSLATVDFPVAMDSRSALFQVDASAKLFADASLLGEEEALAEAEERRGEASALVLSVLARVDGLAGIDPAILRQLERISGGLAELAPLRRGIFDAMSGQADLSPEAFQEMARRHADLSDQLRANLARVADELSGSVDASIAGIAEANRRQNLISLAISIGVVVIGTLLVLWVVRVSIVRPVEAIVEGLAESSREMDRAAVSVAQASQAVAGGASRQAESIEEIGAALQEVSGTTRSNASSAQTAKTAAAGARGAAERGNEAMQRMKSAIEAFQQASNEISGILKTIDEIAFQTNILALNAAVEAARAGEAGAGFSVVAEEVRNLAQRSAAAARETAGRIEVAATRSSQGADISAEMDGVLKEIVSRSGEVDTLVAGIAAASQEQTRSIEQVAASVESLDNHTQSNAASSEEAAATAEEMKSQAEALKRHLAALGAAVRGVREEKAAEKSPAGANEAKDWKQEWGGETETRPSGDPEQWEAESPPDGMAASAPGGRARIPLETVRNDSRC
ncbi:MAG: hypothetical protein EA425_03910 [Puniceicoccaceae bacterium]|nr:MAG: hypothetical protein EA425_03910 [Puniceicoccaceae bacterium]